MLDEEVIAIELASISPELEGPVLMGPSEPDLADRKLNGYIAKGPIGRPFKEIVEESGHEYRATTLDEEFRLWLIPHRFSLLLRSKQAAVTAAGIDVEYDAGGKTCSVVQMWPAPQYRLDASLELKVRVPTPLDGDHARLRLRIGALAIGIGSEVEAKFEAGVVRPIVSAVGVGSRSCSWEFLSDDPPLVGRDLETWSLLLLPKGMTRPLTYRARAWARHRTIFVPTRVESGWVDVTCKLVAG